MSALLSSVSRVVRTACAAVAAKPAIAAARAVSSVAVPTAATSLVPAAVHRAGGAGRFAWAKIGAAGALVAAGVTVAAADDGEMVVFSGNANPRLAEEIASLLGVQLGRITVGRFADGEVNVQVHDNVRGKDVYIVQPTCAPVNEHLVELLLMVSTMRRASAEKITVVMPYYGYARWVPGGLGGCRCGVNPPPPAPPPSPPPTPKRRQDRKMAARVPISAADVARLLESMGVDRVIATDLHCGQIQGFFPPRIPVDNLAAGVVGVRYFAGMPDLHNPVIISPDAGGVYRAKQFREGLNNAKPGADAGLAMIIKQRVKAGQIEKMDLVGNVAGSDCIIVDDMIDTAGTLVSAAEDLKKHGARKVYAFATHGLFSGPAADRIARSVLEAVIVTDTIPLSAASKTTSKITQLPVAPLMAEAIKRVHLRQSVSDLFASGAKTAPKAAAAATPAASAPAKAPAAAGAGGAGKAH